MDNSKPLNLFVSHRASGHVFLDKPVSVEPLKLSMMDVVWVGDFFGTRDAPETGLNVDAAQR